MPAESALDLAAVKVPQWFSSLLLVTCFAVAVSAAHWTFSSISMLQEESTINRVMRENTAAEIHEIKNSVNKILDRTPAK